MEAKNRQTIWVVVFAGLILLCFCTLAAAVVALGVYTEWSFDLGGDGAAGDPSVRVERSFELGREPRLEIDNFAGKVTVRAGESDTLRVIATKRRQGLADLGRIEIDWDESEDGLVIRTRKPASLGNVSVEFEVTAPAGTRLAVKTGAGNTEVVGLSGGVKVATGAGGIVIEDVSAEIEAQTGAGGINVRGASGRVQLHTGAGGIDYEGRPLGDCRFETGAGGIDLFLPGDVNVMVDLDTGLGSIDVDFVMEGRATKRAVKGAIGTGAEGSIYAHTGTGGISVRRQ
jgi:hypothetical protein